MKACSTSSVIKEMQIKITHEVSLHTPQQLKKLTVTNVGEDGEQLDF